MAVNIGPKIGIEGEAQYRKQINDIITQAKTLSSEMKKLESSFTSEGKSVKENSEKRKLLNEQIKTQESRVKELNNMLEQSKAKFGENATQTQKWQQAVNNAETELNQLKTKLSQIPSTLQTVGANMQSFGNSLKSVGAGMKQAGQTMTTRVTAPIVGGLTACIKTTMDFDAEMSKVAAISGATGNDFDSLRDKAIEMGDKTKFSASESAQAMEYMAMAGWKTEDMLSGISGIMSLAAASGEELATTSDIVTDGLTAFGLSAEDSSHFADVLAAASANANTNVSMLGESFKYVAPVAGSLGLSVEDVSVALGLMANSGIKASQGGTALRTLFTNMANPTDTMAAAMDDLGISLTNSEGEMNSLKDIMVQLRAGFGDLKVSEDDYLEALDGLNSELESGEITQEQYDKMLEDWISHTFSAEGAIKAQTAAMLAGKTGMAGLLAIVNSTDEDFAKLTESVNSASESTALLADGSIVPLSEALASGQEVIQTFNGAAEQMSSVMMDNASGGVAVLKSNLQTLAISLGDLLMPTVTDIITSLQGFVQELNSLDDGTKKMIIKGALVAAAIGPILIGVGSLVGAIGTIISAGGALVAGIGTFSTFIQASVIPAISGLAASASAAIPGIVAFVAPFLPFIAIGAAVVAAGVLIYKNWDKIKETAQKVGAAVAEKWGELKTNTLEAWNNIKAKTSETWNNVKSKVTEIAGNIKQSVSEKWDGIKTKTAETWNNVKAKTGEVLKGMAQDTRTNLSNMKAAFDSNSGGIKGTVAALWTGIKGNFKTGFNALNTLTNGKLGEIAGMFSGLKDKALTWGRDMIENFIQGIKDKIQALKDAAAEAAKPITDIFHHSHPDVGPLKDDYKWMPDMMQLYAKGIKDNAYLVTEAVDDVATDISVGFNGYAQTSAENSDVTSAILGAIDPDAIYSAVRDGASDANITIDIDGRDLRRNLSALGVQFA